MSRLLWMILLLVVVLVAGWVWTGGDLAQWRGSPTIQTAPSEMPPTDPSASVSGESPLEDSDAQHAAEVAGNAADAAADAAAKAADAAAEAGQNAADASVAPASDAASQAEVAAEQAIRAADEAASAAARADANAASGDTADANAAAQQAGEATEAAATATAKAADAAFTAAQIEALLTPEGFDAAKVEQIIDGSSIAPAQKTTLKAVVNAAATNPAMLQSALEQVQAVLK